VDDYASFQVANPLNPAEMVTVYNLNRSKQGLVDLLDTTATDRSKARVNYNGLEVSFTARLPKGASAFGGWSADRLVNVSCASYDPNTFRYCDQSQYDLPFRSDFKFAGSYRLPFDTQIGAALASYAGNALTASWNVPPNLFPGGRTQSVTIPITAPGTSYLDRWNQLDLSLRKVFRFGKTRVDGAVDIFNALNSSVILL
jgi:hypothetical protein